MAATDQFSTRATAPAPLGPTTGSQSLRILAWVIVAATLIFLLNNYLIFWRGWPGFQAALFNSEDLSGGDAGLAWLQVASYFLCLILPIAYVMAKPRRSLRDDSDTMTAFSAYIIRAAFWMVLFVGLADMVISFLRVEELLEAVVGAQMTTDLGRSQYRGPFVHMPLALLALVLAAFTRTLGFQWLALLVVVAEFAIVITRFIFSYEQAFMGDLVRFWYAALFLFASAYTLIEEGHVRVDVLYAGFSKKTRGYVNAIGSLILGISLCWVILALGMGSKSTVINSPLLSYEVSQSGFGMYVKYLMAGFLAIFAISMMIQFTSYLLESAADVRGDPGGREHPTEIAH